MLTLQLKIESRTNKNVINLTLYGNVKCFCVTYTILIGYLDFVYAVGLVMINSWTYEYN